MESDFKLPFYAKASIAFIGLIAFTSILYIAQDIIVPIIYSIIIAIVLSPIVGLLERRKINRIIAITITLTFVTLVTILTIALLSSQIMQFGDSIPKLTEEFRRLLDQTIAWASDNFNISTRKINLWITKQNTEILNGSTASIGQTIINTGSILVVLVLIPVYVFMILVYQSHLLEFIHKLFRSSDTLQLNSVISATKKIIQSYLVGLLLEALIVAVLNATSLLILGIDYAIILGVIGAVLNVIPYIGGIVAVALPMIVAIATKSPSYALLVLVAYILIQFIDNNYIIPKIVASKVKINALISIIVVLVGGASWGIPGMFLAIPLTAILKVIFDHIEPLKPLGFLLGNIVPTVPKKLFFIPKK